ncbi:MAG: hypothetical protein WCO16_01420 [bacterium]
MKKGFDYLFENTDELPPEIAEVVLGFNFTQGFRSLINKYKLHLDQAEVLEDMTFRVMFADMTGTEFTAKLVSELGLAPVTAKELTDDTNTNIIEPVKKAIQDKINGMLEEYKDIELDEEPTPSPEVFHPKSAYNEPITNDTPTVHHLAPIKENKLTHADVLHGIENPHPSIGGNSPIRTASGSKSYADIMGGGETATVKQQPIIEVKPEPKPAPAPSLQQKVDLIAMKSSAVVVSAPNKIETLPAKAPENLPTITSVDPYKETI